MAILSSNQSKWVFCLWLAMILLLAAVLSGCAAGAVQVIPTARPSDTPTPTDSPTSTPDPDAPTATPTITPTLPGGATATPLLGPTRTPSGEETQPPPAVNPNAPRIEFFTSDKTTAAPGEELTLFWSTRGATRTVIYQLDRSGQRERLWNVGTDGTQRVTTRLRDRGQVDFLLVATQGSQETEQRLSIPLACPVEWFFEPPPAECPDTAAVETFLIEQPFERGRMVYISSQNQVYALFNDGFEPAWIARENRYDPAIHPEREEAFVPPPDRYQPIGRLGFAWRSDTVRNRLGLALQPELAYDGFVQVFTQPNGTEILYISSLDSTVLQLLPRGESWQIITIP